MIDGTLKRYICRDPKVTIGDAVADVAALRKAGDKSLLCLECYIARGDVDIQLADVISSLKIK